jgi:hypothetical protein
MLVNIQSNSLGYYIILWRNFYKLNDNSLARTVPKVKKKQKVSDCVALDWYATVLPLKSVY